MLKWVGVIIIFILLIYGIFVHSSDNSNTVKRKTDRISITSEPLIQDKTQSSLFVPYWSISTDYNFGDYNQIIYFGITPDRQGISKTDTGYLRLSEFTNNANGREKLLVLRMLDSKLNFDILKDSGSQSRIISETIAVAKEYNFSGIVLDLELSALPFDSVIQQINTFNKRFFAEVKKENLAYLITIYGDVYYRIRPFDVKTMAQFSDRIMIMAYDFHKAGGNPGPNFPLGGKEKYGYDFYQLIDKLLTEVPSEKIVIIFGLYGYDWQVDDAKISQTSGKPLSYLEIKNSIIANCAEFSCSIKRDSESAETVINYTAEDGEKHLIWYEDMESVNKKQKFLKSKGINNFSFWAHSYF